MVEQQLYRDHGVAFDRNWANEHHGSAQDFIVDPEDRYREDEQPAHGSAPLEPIDESAEPEEPREENGQAREDASGDDGWDETLRDEPVNPGGDETLIQDENDLEEDNMAIDYAPGEHNRPISLFHDQDAEFCAFPAVYGGKRLLKPDGVSYGKMSKYLIRNKDRRFATRPDFLLYRVMRQTTEMVNSAINICLRQRQQRGNITAGQLLDRRFVNELVEYDAGKCPH